VPIVETDPIGQRARVSRPHRVHPPAPAKIRILETANRLFYDEGIRSVGIDRLISESGVTKATFYKHYGSKDRLILDYVTARHQSFVAALNALVEATPDPADASVTEPAVLLTPYWVNEKNMETTVIKDKFVDATKLCASVGQAVCTAAGIQ